MGVTSQKLFKIVGIVSSISLLETEQTLGSSTRQDAMN